MEDSIYVVALLSQPGSITVNSGSNSAVTWNAPAGAYAQKVPMGVGAQKFTLSRNGQSVLSGTSPKQITNNCPCGVNNFNAFVGQLPFEPFGSLDGSGLGEFMNGLTEGNCQARPSIDGGSPTTLAPTRAPTSNPPQPTSNPPDCNDGTNRPDVSGNLSGLCGWACQRGYCPSDVCTCTGRGGIIQPTWGSPKGCPLPGEGSEYIGLCDFTCSTGYCPDTACTRNNCLAK